MNSAKTEVVYVVQRWTQLKWMDLSYSAAWEDESQAAAHLRFKRDNSKGLKFQLIERKTTVEERVIE